MKYGVSRVEYRMVSVELGDNGLTIPTIPRNIHSVKYGMTIVE
jgi:hypothetical protein